MNRRDFITLLGSAAMEWDIVVVREGSDGSHRHRRRAQDMRGGRRTWRSISEILAGMIERLQQPARRNAVRAGVAFLP
jgi:hypothetical protein